MPTLEIRPATGATDLAAVRALWREYWASFGLDPTFQNFAEELAALPGPYHPILLALDGGNPVGAAALRPFDQTRCEAKRLYVRPLARGHGVGRALLLEAMAAARALGYTELYADTLPAMQSALELYRRLGFERIPAYSDTPTPGAIYLRVRLS